MPDETDEKIRKVSFMVKTFQLERYIYLFFTFGSCILLAICVIMFLHTKTKGTNEITREDVAYVAGMFGSGGLVGLTASRILKMWTDCINMLR